MAQRALVVGGGIGGLTAALSLARVGIDVEVFEQAPAFGEIGAGIQLSPNAVRVLHHLGLEQPLAAIGFRPEALEMRTWRVGWTVSRAPLGDAVQAAFGFPYYHVHRADLINLLAQAVNADARINTRLATRCTGVEQDADSVTLTMHDGAKQQGDFVLGADGLHSVVREALWGAAKPRFTGNVAWRATVPADALPEGLIRPVCTVWMGPHSHFVTYFVKQGRLVNFVAVVEKSGWEVESWTEKGDKAELIADYAGWHDTVQQLTAATDPEGCYKWALLDRDPMTQWSDGRITMLGDACHPTLPMMAQGAAMAIEDGAVLAGCLDGASDISAALSRYESLRKERTSNIQLGSRGNTRNFHLPAPAAWWRNLRWVMTRQALSGGGNTGWLYGYDALSAAN